MTRMCSVVVPTCRRPDLLARCLAALIGQTLPGDGYEIIVADDAASPDTQQQVEQYAESARCRIRYLPVRDTQGPAAARNAGWRAAQSPIIAFTDDDCLPSATWLVEGCRALDSEQAAAAAGRVVMPLPSVPTDYQLDAAGLSHAEFVTANCFCRRDVLAEIHGFDERFAVAWREDSDLQFTLLEHGCKIVRADEAVVVHPIRPAPWGVSLRQQRKTQFDALLERKHGDLYHQRLPPFPMSYYAFGGAAATTMLGLGLRSRPMILLGLAAWLGLTGWFAARRLRKTSHSPSHVAEMAVTSAWIPLLSLYWRWRGQRRFGNSG